MVNHLAERVIMGEGLTLIVFAFC